MRTAPPHGTRRRYQWRAAPCRCQRCRKANADYHRHWWHHRTRWTQPELPAELMPREPTPR